MKKNDFLCHYLDIKISTKNTTKLQLFTEQLYNYHQSEMLYDNFV